MPWIKQLLRLKSNFGFVYCTSNRLIDTSVDLLVEAVLAMAALYTCVFQVACFPAGTLPCWPGCLPKMAEGFWELYDFLFWSAFIFPEERRTWSACDKDGKTIVWKTLYVTTYKFICLEWILFVQGEVQFQQYPSENRVLIYEPFDLKSFMSRLIWNCVCM